MNTTRICTRRVRWLAIGVNVGAVLTAGLAWAQSSEPLLQQANLIYQGAFRVPQNLPLPATFSYGGSALAYYAPHNSLYMIGHAQHQQSTEISIPAVVNSTSISGLNIATQLQPFTDPTDGTLNSINPTNVNPEIIGGQLVYNDKLILAAYSYYDGRVSQSSSHFVRPLILSTTGQAQGPFKVGSLYPGYVGGYMASVPTEWQSSFGGPSLTGNCCVPGASWESEGPALSVFDPSALGARIPAPATPLVGYPLAHALGGGSWNSQNAYFNGTTRVTGVAFPSGTRSVLFFGRHGTGPFCYGEGTSDQTLARTIIPKTTNVVYCYDPAQAGTKGTHAYPYVYQVWAYDANDLLAAKNGSKLPYQVQPYTIWTYKLPFEVSDSRHLIGGAAFDTATQRIYVSQECVDANCTPIIQVFKVNGALATPSPPTDVSAR